MWEKAHIVQYYNLFTTLSGHEDTQDPLGQHTLMLYLDKIRNDWHDSIIAKSIDNTVFDISTWSDRRYDTCKQHIKDRTTSSLLNEARPLLSSERDHMLPKQLPFSLLLPPSISRTIPVNAPIHIYD